MCCTKRKRRSTPPRLFKKEAYRIPRFEVQLDAPDIVPHDRPFQVTLTADYYAGGRVVGNELSWRVNVFPYTHRPKAHEGFLFSSDERFGEGRSSRYSDSVSKDKTDENVRR